jgi:hypothetical protein
MHLSLRSQAQGEQVFELPIACDGIAVVSGSAPDLQSNGCLSIADLRKIWELRAEGGCHEMERHSRRSQRPDVCCSVMLQLSPSGAGSGADARTNVFHQPLEVGRQRDSVDVGDLRRAELDLRVAVAPNRPLQAHRAAQPLVYAEQRRPQALILEVSAHNPE